MRYTPNTRGFIFPFVVFFIVAGVFVVSEIYFYHTSGNSYDELARFQNQSNTALEDQASVFHDILVKTNSNGSGTGAGADNDDYALTGSGWTGTDDDIDAFTYRFGALAPLETRNILLVNPTYCSYVSGLSLSSIGTLTLTLSSTGNITLYQLDSSSRVIGQRQLTGSASTNTIDVTGINTADGLAVFLTNTSSGSSLSYTLSANNTSAVQFINFIPATNLGAGKYIYYSNLLSQDTAGNFFPFSRVFAN